ncbi:hypothetical protein BRADI_4g12760v3 [Brachypodium distachyon]|uniref:Secreted protein n=1 Tax=Brachypodium distachyon TaxID=15368 RepID=I1IK45_BRADI|nr:hypothetical protein BRADI_4g12760v3 [Brachypodium distachyon]
MAPRKHGLLAFLGRLVPALLGTPRTVAAVLGAPGGCAAIVVDGRRGGRVRDVADFGDEVLEEVTNGFFRRVARVPQPPSTPSDEGPISSADVRDAEGSEYFDAAEEEGSSGPACRLWS